MPGIDKESVILMTKLAIYDEGLGKKDRKKLAYFRHDYIYRQNMWMRFYVICGCFVLFLIYSLRKFMSEGFDLISFDYRSEAIKMLVFLVIVLTVYSFAGTIKYTYEYERAAARNEAYMRLINRLETHREAVKAKDEAAESVMMPRTKRLSDLPGRDGNIRAFPSAAIDRGETIRIPSTEIKQNENINLYYNTDRKPGEPN